MQLSLEIAIVIVAVCLYFLWQLNVILQWPSCSNLGQSPSLACVWCWWGQEKGGRNCELLQGMTRIV